MKLLDAVGRAALVLQLFIRPSPEESRLGFRQYHVGCSRLVGLTAGGV